MSEAKNFVQPAIPCFAGHYDHWSMLMKNLLRSKGVQSTKTQQKELKDLMVKDLKFEGNARVKRLTLKALKKDFEILEMKVDEHD
ncbi:hypothetical protein CR513_56396, partial [Mucuna pruriens]